MSNIIAVVSGKGGTGKTSFTANVGLALSMLGYKTLCLDCDITLRNLDLALGLSDRAVMDFSDVANGRCTLAEAVAGNEKYPNLDLLSAPLCDGDLDVTEAQIRTLAAEIRSTYAYCLIDSPAGLGIGFRLALAMADSAVVVTTTDTSALRDAQRTVTELKNFPTNRVHLVVNRVDKKLLRSMHMTIDDAIDTAGLPLLGVIPEDKDIPYALNRGIPLRECNYFAERAYENIAKRLVGRRVPLLKI